MLNSAGNIKKEENEFDFSAEQFVAQFSNPLFTEDDFFESFRSPQPLSVSPINNIEPLIAAPSDAELSERPRKKKMRYTSESLIDLYKQLSDINTEIDEVIQNEEFTPNVKRRKANTLYAARSRTNKKILVAEQSSELETLRAVNEQHSTRIAELETQLAISQDKIKWLEGLIVSNSNIYTNLRSTSDNLMKSTFSQTPNNGRKRPRPSN